MATTAKQIAANQKNAQQSTGPRTPQGKTKSAANATTHGIYAESPVINSPYLKESQQDYDLLQQGIIDELKPRGPFEHQLVATIANCLWRQNRAINAETAHINNELLRQSQYSLYPAPNNETDELTQRKTDALARSIPTGSFSAELLRYEMRLDIRLSRALKTLNQLQSKRQTEQEQLRNQEAELDLALEREKESTIESSPPKTLLDNPKGKVRPKQIPQDQPEAKQFGNEPISHTTPTSTQTPRSGAPAQEGDSRAS